MHTKPSFKIIRENILLSENQKEKHRSKNSLYYTEKKSSFVDVFLEKFINLFGKIKNGHHLSYHITRNKKYEIADQVWCVFAIV